MIIYAAVVGGLERNTAKKKIRDEEQGGLDSGIIVFFVKLPQRLSKPEPAEK